MNETAMMSKMDSECNADKVYNLIELQCEGLQRAKEAFEAAQIIRTALFGIGPEISEKREEPHNLRDSLAFQNEILKKLTEELCSISIDLGCRNI